MKHRGYLHPSAQAIEEMAEKYVLGHLTAPEFEAYEEHLLVCGRCRDAVQSVDDFIEVFSAAVPHARRLSSLRMSA